MIRIDLNIHKLDIIAEVIQISTSIHTKATLVSYHIIITLTVVSSIVYVPFAGFGVASLPCITYGYMGDFLTKCSLHSP